MAQDVPRKMTTHRPLSPTFGKQLLEIVTAGMYSDPCMVLREYIQNSADSIDLGIDKGTLDPNEGRIEIRMEGRTRSLLVEDNGLGIPNDEIEERLGGLGTSQKEGTGLRGFRGIGRLGGLTHCDLLTFETRAKGDDSVGIVEWDGKMLRDSIEAKGKKGLSDAISAIARISYRGATVTDPPHFFRVTLANINRFHTDRLTSLDVVTHYLSRVAPLPFDKTRFSFATEIDQFLEGFPGYRTHSILLNGRRLFSPYADEFQISAKKTDRIKNIDFVRFESNGKVFGKGWIAKTSLLGNIPKTVVMRGISVRQGNIEVGDEKFLVDYFLEPRFGTWHMGAFHLDYSLRPNARRDGFEETENHERFLEQVTGITKKMSQECRASSKERYSKEHVENSLANVERFAKGGLFVDKAHFENVRKDIERRLSQLEELILKKDYEHVHRRVESLKTRLVRADANVKFVSQILDGRALRSMRHSKFFEHICHSVRKNIKQSALSDRVLAEVLRPFLKPKHRRRVSLFTTS
jgi:hypothetical protein